MNRLHLHLLSDSTGETLENIAKAALAQFDGVEIIKHFWPMVRSEKHLNRILAEVADNPGLVIFTIVNRDIRTKLERECRHLGLPSVPALDTVTDALSNMLGQEAKARPGRQHILDAAYFARVEAIQFTIAHDDGVGWENWEAADIVLAGVSRTSKTPTSIYLANRGFKTANIPIVPDCRIDHRCLAARPGTAQPSVVAEPGAGNRLCQRREGQGRNPICPADVRRQWLADDRRDPPVYRGIRCGNYQSL